jgi:hypothetical protein
MTLYDQGLADHSVLGVRRRCFWCGVKLRAWQLNACRQCRRAHRNNAPSPPFPRASRWDDPPDRWRWMR